MANIIGEMPLTNGKWRKLMQMSQATTGRTMPDSTLSAMLKGEYDSIYDNYYRNLSLAQQQQNADRNYDLLQRQLDMQEEMFDKQNSMGTMLGNAAMQMGTAYAYGAGTKGMDIIPTSLKSGWNKLMPGDTFDFNLTPNTPPVQAQSSTVLSGQKQIPGVTDLPSYNASRITTGTPSSGPSSAIGGPNEQGIVDGLSKLGQDTWSGIKNVGSDVMDFFGLGSPTANVNPSINTSMMARGLTPYASNLETMVGGAAPMTMAPTASLASQAAQQQMMSQVGVAPTMTTIGGDVAGKAITGTTIAEGGANVATDAMTSGLATNVVGGLGGTIVGIGVGKMLEGLGIDGPASGFLAGAAGGAVTGAAWGGTVGNLPGAIVGAIVGGVLGLISSLFDSWICGMVDKYVGMTDHEKESMKQLKNWCKVNQRDWLRWYIAHGEELVEFIEEAEDDITDYCAQLRIVMIEPIVALIDAGQMESAYKVYRTMAKLMFYTYAPHIYIPEDSTMKRRYENAESDSALQ